LLYDLSFLLLEPEWVRHAVQVAGQLADMLITQDPHSPQIREAVVGTLMHTLGKPLLISEDLPTLDTHMTPSQRKILQGHSTTLLKRLAALEWSPSPVCLDILENANERLDGSGYPQGKSAGSLSTLVKTLSIIKAVNKLTHGRNGNPGRPPWTPTDGSVAPRAPTTKAYSSSTSSTTDYIQSVVWRSFPEGTWRGSWK